MRLSSIARNREKMTSNGDDADGLPKFHNQPACCAKWEREEAYRAQNRWLNPGETIDNDSTPFSNVAFGRHVAQAPTSRSGPSMFDDDT